MQSLVNINNKKILHLNESIVDFRVYIVSRKCFIIKLIFQCMNGVFIHVTWSRLRVRGTSEIDKPNAELHSESSWAAYIVSSLLRGRSHGVFLWWKGVGQWVEEARHACSVWTEPHLDALSLRWTDSQRDTNEYSVAQTCHIWSCCSAFWDCVRYQRYLNRWWCLLVWVEQSVCR